MSLQDSAEASIASGCTCLENEKVLFVLENGWWKIIFPVSIAKLSKKNLKVYFNVELFHEKSFDNFLCENCG
jgi:hypothetical protein